MYVYVWPKYISLPPSLSLWTISTTAIHTYLRIHNSGVVETPIGNLLYAPLQIDQDTTIMGNRNMARRNMLGIWHVVLNWVIIIIKKQTAHGSKPDSKRSVFGGPGVPVMYQHMHAYHPASPPFGMDTSHLSWVTSPFMIDSRPFVFSHIQNRLQF